MVICDSSAGLVDAVQLRHQMCTVASLSIGLHCNTMWQTFPKADNTLETQGLNASEASFIQCSSAYIATVYSYSAVSNTGSCKTHLRFVVDVNFTLLAVCSFYFCKLS